MVEIKMSEQQQRKLIESWILEYSCRCLCKEFVKNNDEDKMSDVMESNFKLITDILGQYSTEDLSGVQTKYVLLAELCVRIQEKRYQDQNDDSENQGSWNVGDCITFLGKELKIPNNRTSKLVSAFEELSIGKGKEMSGTLDAGGQEKHHIFMKDVKAFTDEICKKLGLSFLEEIANLIDQVKVPNRLSQEDFITLFKEHRNEEVRDEMPNNEENESAVPKTKTYKRLYNAKRNILADVDEDSTAAHALFPSSRDAKTSKSSDGFRSFFPTKKAFAGGYNMSRNKKTSSEETEVVKDTPVDEMQEELSDGSSVVSPSKKMHIRLRINSSDSQQSDGARDAYPARQRKTKKEATKSTTSEKVASSNSNVDESNVIDDDGNDVVDDDDDVDVDVDDDYDSNHTRRSPSKATARRDDNTKKLKKFDRKKDRMTQELDDSDILDATSEKSQLTRRSPRAPAKIAYSECDDSEDEADSVVSDQPWIPEADEANRMDDMSEELQTTRHTLQPPTKKPRKDPINKTKKKATKSSTSKKVALRNSNVDESNVIDDDDDVDDDDYAYDSNRSRRSPSKATARRNNNAKKLKKLDRKKDREPQESDDSDILDATSEKSQLTRRSPRAPAKMAYSECDDSEDEADSVVSDQPWIPKADEANRIDDMSEELQTTRHTLQPPTKKPRKEIDPINKTKKKATKSSTSKKVALRNSNVDESNVIDDDVDDDDYDYDSNRSRRSPSKATARRNNNAKKLKKLDRKKDREPQESDDSDILDATSEKSQLTRRSPRVPAKIAYSECDDSEDEADSVVSDQPWIPEADEANRMNDMSEESQTTRHILQPPTKKPRKEIDPINKKKKEATKSNTLKKEASSGSNFDESNVIDDDDDDDDVADDDDDDYDYDSNRTRRSPSKATARRDNNAKKLKKLDRKKDRMSQESDDSDILDATSEKSQLTRRSPRVPAKIAYSECDDSEDEADSVVSDQPWISEADEANGSDDMSEELHTTRHILQPPTKNPRKEIDHTNKVGSTKSDLPSKHLDEANITDATSKTSQSNRRSTRSTAEIPRQEKDSQDEVGSDASAQRTERRAKQVVEANIIDAISKTSQSNRRSTRSTAEIPRREKDSQDEVVSDTPAQRTERHEKEVDEANIIDAISKTSQSNRRSTRSTAEIPRREKDSQDEVVSDTSAQRTERRAKEVDEANIIDAISKTSQSNRRNTRSTAEVPRREKDSQVEVGSDTSAQRTDRLSEQVVATSKTWQSTPRSTRSPAEVPRREKDSQNEVGSDTSAQRMERRSNQVDEANIIDAPSKIWQSTRRSTRSPAKKPSRPEPEDPHSEADSTSAHRNGERLLKEVDTSNMTETGNERPTKIRMLTTPQKTIPKQGEQDIINQKELPPHQSPSVRISPLRASDVSSSQEQNSRGRHATRGWKNATTKKHESSPAANRVRTSRKAKYSDIFVDILNESSSEEEIDKENDFFEPEEILQQTKRNESKWKSTRIVKSREQPRRKQQPKDVSFEFSSEGEVMDSILEEGNTSSTVQHGGRRKFTKDEEEYIRQGVRRFGVGHWKEILARYPFQNRTSVNLKDKWRNMVKNGQT